MKNRRQHMAIFTTSLVALLIASCAGFLLLNQPAMGQPGQEQESLSHADELVLAQAGGRWMDPGQWMDHGPMMGRGRPSMIRHHYYMRNGLPADYRGKISPLSPSATTVAEGALLYTENCASCHGARGLGDGEAGRDLKPPPANIAHMMGMPMYNDAYLFWTVSEGGAPVGSAMPPFKDVLSDEEIWKIIAAMRAGFPAPANSK